MHHVDFDHRAPGAYDTTMLAEDFRRPRWSFGVEEGRARIVEDGGSAALEVHYPEWEVGPRTNGISFALDLPRDYRDLYVRYRIKFAEGFDFRSGGKIPGLFGGERNTGGTPPDGTDGWSARMMWRENGAATSYVYHPDQPRKWGQYFWWNTSPNQTPWKDESQGDLYHFEPGVWHTIEQRVRMNTPGLRNGLIEGWIDGELAMRVTDIRFRTVDSFAIDGFYFNTFFGGQKDHYRTIKDETVRFDDITIATERIGPEPR